MIHVINGLILISLIIIIALILNKNNYFKVVTYVVEKMIDSHYPICLVNYYTNKISIVNDRFCDIVNKDKELLLNEDILDIGLFMNYNDFISIKTFDKTDGYKIIRSKDNHIYKISYNQINIGPKKYILLSVEDKTNLIDYIKRLGLFTKIADNNKEGIIVVNFNNDTIPVISYVNNSIGNITGYSINEVINKPLAVLFETNVDKDTLDKLYTSLKNKKETTLEYQYFKRDGSICWIRTNMVPVIRQSVLDKLIELDRNSEFDGLDDLLNITDFDIYITLYQTDITDYKQNHELPIKAYMNKVDSYNRSIDKFFNIIDSLLNIPLLLDKDNNHKDDILNEVIKIVGTASDSDKCYVYKIINDKMYLSNIWREDEFVNNSNLIEGLSFEEAGMFKLYSKLILNKCYYITEDMITNNVCASQMFRMNSIKSCLIYPIIDDKELIGFIGINSPEIKEWNDNIHKLLRMVSNKLVNIIKE